MKRGHEMIDYVIIAIIIVLAGLVVFRQISRKKRGESGCCGCSGCSSAGSCLRKDKKEK